MTSREDELIELILDLIDDRAADIQRQGKKLGRTMEQLLNLCCELKVERDRRIIVEAVR